MKQSFLIILYTLCVMSSLFSQENDILISMPKEVVAGNEFLLIISFPKNHMNGVSRLQLQLPNGFVPQAKNTENADFKFENQKATFQWLTFPVDQIVEVSMTVSVAPTMEGYFVVKGISNWISNNEPLRTDIYPQVITVRKGEKSAQELTKSFEKTKYSYDEFTSEGVACIRQVPFEKDGEVFVNIMVSKGDLNKYGKIQETIPVGYKVENLKSHNAIFIYNEKQRVIKYMWMSMPEKPKFVVSYKLIPTEAIDKSNPFMIFGTFYYAENNKTLTIDIVERGIELQEE